MDELEVLMDKHKPNLTSARKNLIQVLNELSIAYPKEKGNIYDYWLCFELSQDNVNLKNLSEIMKSFEEEIRKDYAGNLVVSFGNSIIHT
uniref:SJCHGC04048 protein n=1 Tax=Schistosoma japonicum TaxID=6182 RepID=Q5BSJ2_SCHJA|nr:SJCHGC04048 protein [Schistosoma japonicum]